MDDSVDLSLMEIRKVESPGFSDSLEEGMVLVKKIDRSVTICRSLKARAQ